MQRRVRYGLAVGAGSMALAILVACSGDDEGSPPSVTEAGTSDGATAEAGDGSTTTPNADGASDAAADVGGDAGKDADAAPCVDDASTCKSECAVIVPPTINPPAAKMAGCDDTQIAALADICFDEPEGAGCKVAREAVPYKSCADCIFGAKTDAQWKMILLMPGETPPARYNVAGCIERATGIVGCGKKHFTAEACVGEWCGSCTAQQLQQCEDAVRATECKSVLPDQTCSNAIATLNGTCFPAESSAAARRTVFVEMAKLFCK